MPQVQLANEETPDRSSMIKRRLAAIAFADVAGFSRLMAVDEVETVRRWRELRSEIMESHMARHRGRVAEISGGNCTRLGNTAAEGSRNSIKAD